MKQFPEVAAFRLIAGPMRKGEDELACLTRSKRRGNCVPHQFGKKSVSFHRTSPTAHVFGYRLNEKVAAAHQTGDANRILIAQVLAQRPVEAVRYLLNDYWDEDKDRTTFFSPRRKRLQSSIHRRHCLRFLVG